MNQAMTETAMVEAVATIEERRADRRRKIATPVLASPSDPRYREEVQTALNASRDGLYFTTHAEHYYVGMRLTVTLGYSPAAPCNSPSFGEVVRIERVEDGCFGIAVRIVLR